MAIPPLDDKRLDLLVAVYATAARELSDLLSELVDLAESPRRFLIFQQIQAALRNLDQETDVWSQRFIRTFFEEADIKAISAIRSAGITSTLNSEANLGAVSSLVNNLRGTLNKGRQSVELLANKIFRNPAVEREFPNLAFQVQREVAVGLTVGEATIDTRGRVARLLRKQFRDGIVSVVGSDGRRYSFPLDTYAAMVAQSTKAQAQSVATIRRANEAGMDLVRVTPNPSTTGDWCDAYRGRVFSISGADPVYPPLAAIPNGGPPFHPWCKHGLGIFVEAFHTESAKREFSQVDERFLMQPGEPDSKRVIRNWWKASRENSLPPTLRNA